MGQKESSNELCYELRTYARPRVDGALLGFSGTTDSLTGLSLNDRRS